MSTFRFVLFVFTVSFLAFSCGTEPSPNSPSETAKREISTHVKFEKLDPAQTGVDFNNQIVEDNSRNYFIYNYIYIGGGVATADFNNDGLEDLYFVSNIDSNKLYINKGNFVFEKLPSTSGVAIPGVVKTGVTIVDVNQDGYPDIYQCVTGEINADRKNRLLINNGDLTFSERAADYGLALENPSTSATFLDYDRDGDLDMYVINRPVDYRNNDKVRVQEIDGKRVRITTPRDNLESDRLLQNNQGRFSDISDKAGISNSTFSLSVAATDVNNDGYPDIYVANDYIEPDQLYINQRNGTFKDETDAWFGHMPHSSMGSDVADLNGDGRAEILTVDMLADDHYRQLTNATSMRFRRYATLVDYGYGKQIMRNMLQSNNGNGTFSELACYAGLYKTDWSWGPLLFDADNDGLRDIYITNGFMRDVGDLDYNDYTIDSLQKAGLSNNNLMSALSMMPSQKLANYMYYNEGDLSFTDISTASGHAQETFSNGAVYADFNNDGLLDLAVHNNDDFAGIFKNTTPSKNYINISLKGKKGNLDAVGAKVTITYSSKTDYTEVQPTRGFFSSQTKKLHFGVGEAATIDKIEVLWPNGEQSTLTNQETNQHLVIEQRATNKQYSPAGALPRLSPKTMELTAYTHPKNGVSHFETAPLLYREFSEEGPIAAVADINNDGLDDIYFGGTYGTKGKIAIQQKSGNWVTESTPFANDQAFEDGTAIFFDADGDDDLDLFVGSSGVGKGRPGLDLSDRLYINEAGSFTKTDNLFISARGHTATATSADLDGDGDLDLVVGHHSNLDNFPAPEQNVIYLNVDGKFEPSAKDILPGWKDLGMINSIRKADLDQDGTAELIIAGEWMAPQIYKKEGQTWQNKSDDYGLSSYTGLWFDVIDFDVDNDGDLDLIAGNIGLNTRLEASLTHPLKLSGYDLDANGQRDPIVFSAKGQNTYYPYARREEITKSVPMFAKRYPRFKYYAKATMDDLLQQPTDQLKEAAILASTVFINDKGVFKGAQEDQHLPPQAQYAPMRGLTKADVTGDGTADLLSVGNIYGMEIHGGALDAGKGLILSPSTSGLTFRKNEEHQFFAQGDTRSIYTLTTNSGEALLILRNGASPLLHKL